MRENKLKNHIVLTTSKYREDYMHILTDVWKVKPKSSTMFNKSIVDVSNRIFKNWTHQGNSEDYSIYHQKIHTYEVLLKNKIIYFTYFTKSKQTRKNQ